LLGCGQFSPSRLCPSPPLAALPSSSPAPPLQNQYISLGACCRNYFLLANSTLHPTRWDHGACSTSCGVSARGFAIWVLQFWELCQQVLHCQFGSAECALPCVSELAICKHLQRSPLLLLRATAWMFSSPFFFSMLCNLLHYFIIFLSCGCVPTPWLR
jgi:hypothetical protein